MAMPERAMSNSRLCTSTLAPTSMPRVGSSTISTFGLQRQPARQHHLLLVAAGEVGDDLLGARHADVQRLAVLLDQRASPSPRRRRRPIARRGRAMAIDRLMRMASDRNSACCLRSSGTRPMPWRIASCGEGCATGLPSTSDAAGVERVGAEDRARHLGAAGADQAGDAEDLAAADAEARRRRARWRSGRGALPRRDRSFDRERHLARASCRSRWLNSALTSRPTIMRMMPSMSVSATLPLPTKLAVAQHRVAVADLEHLLEAVRDEDDAEALAP